MSDISNCPPIVIRVLHNTFSRSLTVVHLSNCPFLTGPSSLDVTELQGNCVLFGGECLLWVGVMYVMDWLICSSMT